MDTRKLPLQTVGIIRKRDMIFIKKKRCGNSICHYTSLVVLPKELLIFIDFILFFCFFVIYVDFVFT